MTNCSEVPLNLFRFTFLSKMASVRHLESHTNKKTCIYVKTMGFKPFRDTYLHGTFSQSLLNHILTKNRDGGGGHPLPPAPVTSALCESRLLSGRITGHGSRATNHGS